MPTTVDPHARRFGLRKRIRKSVPLRIVVYWRAVRKLTSGERKAFFKWELRRVVGSLDDAVARPSPAQLMLFVCHGNIIRSPMAAALLSQRLAELCPAIAVKSAGFHAEPGRPADPRALALAGEFGVSLDDHRATKISADLVEQAGAIFLMDGLNRAELVSRYPEAASKAFMLGAWLDERRLPGLEIADPYDGDDTDILRCYELLESAIRNLTFDLFPGTFDKSGEPA